MTTKKSESNIIELLMIIGLVLGWTTGNWILLVLFAALAFLKWIAS